MKICVLQPSYRRSRSAISGVDPARDVAALLPGDEVEHAFIDKATAVRQLRDLEADVFVNLCDGAWDEDTPGIEVVRELELRGRAFTGAGSAFYDPTRRVMKQICHYAGVATPAHVFVHAAADVAEALERLRLPCFVKPHHGYNSVGIDERSRVETPEALAAAAERMIREFGGALVEEYVAGRELSVLVASNAADPGAPFVHRPVECLLPPELGYKTFSYKWHGLTRNPWAPCRDDLLAKRLEDMTRAVYLHLDGTGYARADLRVDAAGEPWFLEINPNCSLFYADEDGATADEILQLDGTGKPRFLRRMIDYALRRARAAARPYAVRHERGRGYGMFASRPIAAGELVEAFEEQPHVLVSRSRVERLWSPQRQEQLRHFGWPLTDEIWVMWDSDPESWKPINHSCDPNTWVTGLDLHARRAVAAGEEITMDYATMYTQRDVDFRCTCGAASCRGAWEGDDHLKPWFRERYGAHVTDYVRRKIDEADRAAPSVSARRVQRGRRR